MEEMWGVVPESLPLEGNSISLIPALPLTISVTLTNLLNLSTPQFPQPRKRGSDLRGLS